MTRIVRGTDLGADRSRGAPGRAPVRERKRSGEAEPIADANHAAAGGSSAPTAWKANQWFRNLVVTETTITIASTNGISLTIRQNFSERGYSPFSNFLREADKKPWKP